jgi:uncharacterized YigZ family protein
VSGTETDVFVEPAGPIEVEMKVKRSLFIGRLSPCKSGEEARKILAGAESDHKNANHNCWAYRLGPEPETTYFSDDGEPAGTAGKPILSAIRQSEFVNVMVVVTRYFGGIKLGVRGLIEAYRQVAADVVARTVRVTRVRSRKLVICLPYAIIGEITYLLDLHGGDDVPFWSYGVEVEVAASIKMSAVPCIESHLEELQARKVIRSWSWVSLN